MSQPPAKPPVVGPCPEAELLLCCARTCLDAESAERIRDLLQEDIDWAYLIQTALRHGVMPLLSRSLYTVCPEAVPRAILDQLRDHFRANTLRNFFMTEELLKLLNLLEAHGTPAIPYKGPILAASVYGDLSLRQFSDLDILVRQQHVPRAKELLISQGYQPQTQLNGAQETAYLPSHREYKFVRDDGRVRVELHWRIAAHWQIPSSFPLDPEHLWERNEQVSLAGATVRNLSPEDLLLILCVHGSHHHWERLEWICDVAELIRVHQGMDWRQVIEQASRLGSERMLFLGLFLANDLLRTALPEEVVQRLQADPVVKSLAAQVREWLFREADGGLELSEESTFFIRMRERLWDRVPYYLLYLCAYLRTAMTPNVKDRALLPLPGFLSFLYHLLRPIRLVREYGLRPLKHLLGF